MSGTAEQLESVRRRLARGMIVRTGGFHYESVFGCLDNLKHVMSNVVVCVDLRSISDRPSMFYFKVYVDFHLPIGANVESAEYFKKATISAVKKAKWAERVVGGLEFHRDVILAAEDEKG